MRKCHAIADTNADANADTNGIRTKNNMSPSPSVGGHNKLLIFDHQKSIVYLSRDTHKGSLGYFFEIPFFYKFQKTYLFLTIYENMVVVSLLFTFLEHFKVVYTNMCWYVFMTSFDVVNSLTNLLTLRNMRHVQFYAIVS